MYDLEDSLSSYSDSAYNNYFEDGNDENEIEIVDQDKMKKQ